MVTREREGGGGETFDDIAPYSISSSFQKFFQLCTHRTAFTEASRQTGRLNASIFTESGPVASAVYRRLCSPIIQCVIPECFITNARRLPPLSFFFLVRRNKQLLSSTIFLLSFSIQLLLPPSSSLPPLLLHGTRHRATFFFFFSTTLSPPFEGTTSTLLPELFSLPSSPPFFPSLFVFSPRSAPVSVYPPSFLAFPFPSPLLTTCYNIAGPHPV